MGPWWQGCDLRCFWGLLRWKGAVRRGFLGKKLEQLASLGLPRFPEPASVSSAPPTPTPAHRSPSVH